MYGIIIAEEAEPYIRGRDLPTLNRILEANLRRGRDAITVELDPLCICGEEVPGWYEVDEHGEHVDPVLHDGCRRDWVDEQDAGLYV